MSKSINCNQIYFPNLPDRFLAIDRDIKLLAVAVALILSIPLPPSWLSKLERQASKHELGYKYIYLVEFYLFNWRIFEACLFWLPKNAKTGAHDHQNVINRGRVIYGCIEEVRFRVTRDRVLPTRRRKIAAGGWLKSAFQTAPYAIHELVGASDEMAIALSLYFPGRDY
ncbi:MAG: hypothetical protein SXA11_05740 [Cyanobacteriota bacterium]|nr:hypothetical protein [Cyanobacteriota bacterium]